MCKIQMKNYKGLLHKRFHIKEQANDLKKQQIKHQFHQFDGRTFTIRGQISPRS